MSVADAKTDATHPEDRWCANAGGRPSVLFLFTLLPQFSAVVGCKIWPAFAHLASVRLSVRGPFLPPALRTDTPRGERRGRRGRRGRLPPEHPEAPLNASPPLVSTSSPSRSGTTSQRARERNRAGWRAGARSVSLGRCRARSLSVGRPAGRGCRRRGGIEERLGLLCSVGRLVSLCLFGFGDNEVAAVSDRPPQQAVGEERVGHLARWGRRPSVRPLFLWRGWTRDWWRHRGSWPGGGGVNQKEERCEAKQRWRKQ